MSTIARIRRQRGLPAVAPVAIAVEVLIGIGAVLGGGQFILAPDGHLLGIPLTTLANSPFTSFFVPGLVLFAVIGIGPLAAAVVTYRRPSSAPLNAVMVGVVLMGWVTVEMVLLAGPTSLLWAFYLVLGTALAALGLASSRRASMPPFPS